MSGSDDELNLFGEDGHVNIHDLQAVHHDVGLTLFATIVFLSGEMAGSGMLALPAALANAGWTGCMLMVVGCFVAGYNGVHLGQCWIMLLERYPEYREHCRAPYPAIAQKAVGTWMRRIVEASIDITLFGASLVYSILISQSIHSLFSQIGIHINFCIWLVITVGCLTPLTWFGSPKDFKWVAGIAIISVVAAGCIITVGSILHINTPDHHFEQSPITANGFLLAFGTILFAFGGASTFPTIQHDMQKPAQFKYAVVLAFIVLITLYMPVAVGGYYAFGGDVNANVVLSLPEGPMRMSVEILIMMHLFFAIIIVFNPVAQHFEDIFNIEHAFNWKRVLLRTTMMAVMLFCAEALPHFGAILGLIGGSTVCFLTFVAPSIFYMRLCAAEGNWPNHVLPLHEKVIHIELIIVGILGGLASTYSAMRELTGPGTFVTPCFINATAAQDAQ